MRNQDNTHPDVVSATGRGGEQVSSSSKVVGHSGDRRVNCGGVLVPPSAMQDHRTGWGKTR